MPFVRTKDLLIAYEQAGAGEQSIVLVHGNWGSKRWWQPIQQRLPPAYHSLALDLRGCGSTLGPDHGYTIAEHSVDLRAFLDALGIERTVLVGHSLGGAIVTQFALQWPERVGALVLVAPAPVDGMHMDRQAYQHLPLLKQNRWVLAQVLGQSMPGVPNGLFRESLINDAMRARLAAVSGNGRALERWNVAADVHRLSMPTLIVRGNDDLLITRGHAQRWRRSIAGSRLVTIQRCGHSPNVERPDLLAQVMFSFLDEAYVQQDEHSPD